MTFDKHDDKRPSNPKIQVRFSLQELRVIREAGQFYQTSDAELIRTAMRVFWWARNEVRKGHEVGAYDRETNRFVAVDIPYALEPVWSDDVGQNPGTGSLAT